MTLQELIANWRKIASDSKTSIEEARTLDNCADELEATISQRFQYGEFDND